jgi:hypothetical protein
MKAIDVTVLVCTDGLDDTAIWEAVQSHITNMNEDNIRAIIFEGKVRSITKKERECAMEGEDFTKPFDE